MYAQLPLLSVVLVVLGPPLAVSAIPHQGKAALARQTPCLPPTNISFAAFGHSISSGIGAGSFLPEGVGSTDGRNNVCARKFYERGEMMFLVLCDINGLWSGMNGSYAAYTNRWLGSRAEHFDFYGCAGYTLDGVDPEVSNLGGRKVDVVALSIIGNDFKIGDAAVRTKNYATAHPSSANPELDVLLVRQQATGIGKPPADVRRRGR